MRYELLVKNWVRMSKTICSTIYERRNVVYPNSILIISLLSLSLSHAQGVAEFIQSEIAKYQETLITKCSALLSFLEIYTNYLFISGT